MSFVVQRFYMLVVSVTVLAFLVGGVLLFGPAKLGFADEFDNLLGEAVSQGTSVEAAHSRRNAAESSVRKAWSRFLPSINAYGNFGHTRNNALGRRKGNRNSYDSSEYGVTASLPIYRGGSNYYGLKEAKANAKAEGHNYKDVKQVLLLDTARAILGIIRDREIVSLQRKNQVIVGSILRSTQSRYEGGEATRTDIAIAEDQYFASQSVYTQAVDNLQSNETEFKRIIGRAPGRLPLPRGLPRRLPKNLNEAVALATQQNPQLLAAIFRSKAADHSLKASYSGFLPKVDLNMDYNEERFHGAQIDDDSDLTVKLNFTVPLFQPEAFSGSQVSRHVSQQRKFEARDARLTAKAMATVAWRSYHTAKRRYRLGLVRIKAAQAAAKGMRRELDAGQRTVLDVLDTQERLVEARVQASRAKFERYMSAHLLLSAIGRLDASSSNVVELGDYVRIAKTRKKVRNSKWKLASKRKKPSDKKVQLAAPKNILPKGRKYASEYSSHGSLTTGVLHKKRVSLKIPVLPVLKPREIKVVDVPAVISEPLVVLAPKIVSLPKVKIMPKAIAVRKVKVGPKVLSAPKVLAAPKVKVEPKVVPAKEHKKIKLREMIYSKLKAKKSALSEEIITGSVRSNGEQPVRLQQKQFRAFSIHKIPLPVRKQNRQARVQDSKSSKADVEYYPDTMQNKFAVWWNDKVDKVIGPSTGPKPVLLDSNEYRRKQQK